MIDVTNCIFCGGVSGLIWRSASVPAYRCQGCGATIELATGWHFSAMHYLGALGKSLGPQIMNDSRKHWRNSAGGNEKMPKRKEVRGEWERERF